MILKIALLFALPKTLNSSWEVKMLSIYFNVPWGLSSLMLVVLAGEVCVSPERSLLWKAAEVLMTSSCQQLGPFVLPTGCCLAAAPWGCLALGQLWVEVLDSNAHCNSSFSISWLPPGTLPATASAGHGEGEQRICLGSYTSALVCFVGRKSTFGL